MARLLCSIKETLCSVLCSSRSCPARLLCLDRAFQCMGGGGCTQWHLCRVDNYRRDGAGQQLRWGYPLSQRCDVSKITNNRDYRLLCFICDSNDGAAQGCQNESAEQQSHTMAAYGMKRRHGKPQNRTIVCKEIKKLQHDVAGMFFLRTIWSVEILN